MMHFPQLRIVSREEESSKILESFPKKPKGDGSREERRDGGSGRRGRSERREIEMKGQTGGRQVAGRKTVWKSGSKHDWVSQAKIA